MSSNIVGYEKISLSAGNNLIGVQFSQVGGEDLALGTFVQMDKAVAGYDEDYNFTTTLKIWDATTLSYDTYGWSGSGGTDIDDDPSYDNQWLTLGAETITGNAPAGLGGWVNVPAGTTAVISGEVVSDTKVEKQLVAGYNLVANPYPATVPIATFCTLDSSIEGYDEDYNFTTTLKVWDPATLSYDTYGWSGSSGTDVDDDPSYDNQWLTLGAETTTKEIEYGHGVWINSAAACTATFSNPAE